MFVCCILLSVNLTCVLSKSLMWQEQQRGGLAAGRGLSRPGMTVQRPALIPCLVCQRRVRRDFGGAVSPGQTSSHCPSEERS